MVDNNKVLEVLFDLDAPFDVKKVVSRAQELGIEVHHYAAKWPTVYAFCGWYNRLLALTSEFGLTDSRLVDPE